MTNKVIRLVPLLWMYLCIIVFSPWCAFSRGHEGVFLAQNKLFPYMLCTTEGCVGERGEREKGQQQSYKGKNTEGRIISPLSSIL